MLTLYDAPWIEYLEIDEETGERRLKIDTPKDIREQYNEYCKNKENTTEELRPK